VPSRRRPGCSRGNFPPAGSSRSDRFSGCDIDYDASRSRQPISEDRVATRKSSIIHIRISAEVFSALNAIALAFDI